MWRTVSLSANIRNGTMLLKFIILQFSLHVCMYCMLIAVDGKPSGEAIFTLFKRQGMWVSKLPYLHVWYNINSLLWMKYHYGRLIKSNSKQEQLHLRSEIPTATPWLSILVIHIRSQVKRKQSQSSKFKKRAKTARNFARNTPSEVAW